MIQYIAILFIISHDFGLPILSQWRNIVLLQLNNSLIIYAFEKTITLTFEPYALKTRIRSVIK